MFANARIGAQTTTKNRRKTWKQSLLLTGCLSKECWVTNKKESSSPPSAFSQYKNCQKQRNEIRERKKTREREKEVS